MPEETTTAEPPIAEPPTPKPASLMSPAQWLPTLQLTAAAIALALLIGAVLIAFSSEEVIDDLKAGAMMDAFTDALTAVWDAYRALVRGSLGSWGSIVKTLDRAAPLICAGLGVSLAFRCGLFNIGAQGQLLVAAGFTAYVGFHFDLPPGIHVLAALVTAVVIGGLWGGIAGWLKASTGAHEVISTIMLNYIGGFFLLYLLGKEAFQRPGSDNRLTPVSDADALFPKVADVHLGVVVALIAAYLIWWLLERSTLGFEMRAVGANPSAAETAGMSVKKVYFVAMVMAGMLAGLAAAMQVLGKGDAVSDTFGGSIGFDAITVALLGRATPLGTVLAGLLFGMLSAGGISMQGAAGVAPELAQVLQALIVLFVAAPALMRGLTRMKHSGDDATVMAKGWGG